MELKMSWCITRMTNPFSFPTDSMCCANGAKSFARLLREKISDAKIALVTFSSSASNVTNGFIDDDLDDINEIYSNFDY